MKRKEELEIAAIIVSCFAVFVVLFACLLNRKAMIDFLLCRNWSELEVVDYSNLNDLLFDVGERRSGRLRDEDNEITVSSFFCDVLKVKEIPKCENRADQDEQHLNNTSRFSEPLL